MDQPDAKPINDVAFEDSRKEAARARLILNFLVILSAAASSVFLVYVITRIMPQGQGAGSNVDVPTSAAAEKVGFLRGEHRDAKTDLLIELRDVDEAAGYRESYSDMLKSAMGIEEPGRLYQLSVTNQSKSEPFEFTGGNLLLQPQGAAEFAGVWLHTLAAAAKATPLGKMTLAQSQSRFSLAAGERRDLFVFAPGSTRPPAAEKLVAGSIEPGALLKVRLEHAETTMGR